MKILFINTEFYCKNIMLGNTVHVKNMFIIVDFLKNKGIQVDVLFSNSSNVELKKYDMIIFVNSSLWFQANNFEKLLEYNSKAIYGWITNDYFLKPNTLYKKLLNFVISNYDYTKINNNLNVNLNTLICKPRNKLTEKTYDIVYYGACRKGREKYFEKYFNPNLYVSTSSKAFKKFQALNLDTKATYMNKIIWAKEQETLNLFKFSLYLEDIFTHTHFNYMANRFYEAIMCNVVTLFDVSCLNTVNCSLNYYIPENHIINSVEEINQKILSYKTIDNIKYFEYNEKTMLNEKTETLDKIFNYIKEF